MARHVLVRRIGLISAVPLEGKIIMKHMGKVYRKVPFGVGLYRGNIQGKSVVYIIPGIGKTNASLGATILIERFSPGIIIHFGIGGAYPSSGLKIGDVAIAEKEIYGDEGVLLEEGFQGLETIGIPFLRKKRGRYFNEFPLNKKLFALALHIARCAPCIKVKSGSFLTLSTCTGTAKRAREMEKRFGTICENMEGAAVAQVCTLYGIPLVGIRGISNIVEDRDMRKWNSKLASENCQKAVLALLKAL